MSASATLPSLINTLAKPQAYAITRSSSHPKRVARRPDRSQGHALETIGHAIEYLVDSYAIESHTTEEGSSAEAVQLLAHLSRSIFEECPVVLPLHHRVRSLFFAKAKAWRTGDAHPVPHL